MDALEREMEVATRQKFGRTCSKCDGTGIVRVSHNLSSTLAALGSGLTLKELQKKLRVPSGSTINSRIMRLMAQGLVTRTRDGKSDGLGPSKPYVYRCAAKES